MYRIMIIEDHQEIREELSRFLARNHYDILAPSSFEHTVDEFKQQQPHLMLLDINLMSPAVNGYTLCTEIRKISDVPIIFVTSSNTDADELMSMSLGGDDFITKPYNTAVLLARIAAVLKRAYKPSDDSEHPEYNGLILHLASSQAEYKGQRVEVTRTELKIVYYLMAHKGEIMPRMDLIEYLWDNGLFVDDNTLSVHVTRIRKKLESIGADHFLTTKRGQGYRL